MVRSVFPFRLAAGAIVLAAALPLLVGCDEGAPPRAGGSGEAEADAVSDDVQEAVAEPMVPPEDALTTLNRVAPLPRGEWMVADGVVVSELGDAAVSGDWTGFSLRLSESPGERRLAARAALPDGAEKVTVTLWLRSTGPGVRLGLVGRNGAAVQGRTAHYFDVVGGELVAAPDGQEDGPQEDAQIVEEGDWTRVSSTLETAGSQIFINIALTGEGPQATLGGPDAELVIGGLDISAAD